MSNEFSDELISAYLDGELSAGEQKRVEQMLVENAEHRRTFNELRALRESLQALPSFQLDDHFAGRVLERAEKAMSGESASVVDLASSNDRGNLRIATTIVASVAALLFVSLFLIPEINDNVALDQDKEIEKAHEKPRDVESDSPGVFAKKTDANRQQSRQLSGADEPLAFDGGEGAEQDAFDTPAAELSTGSKQPKKGANKKVLNGFDRKRTANSNNLDDDAAKGDAVDDKGLRNNVDETAKTAPSVAPRTAAASDPFPAIPGSFPQPNAPHNAPAPSAPFADTVKQKADVVVAAESKTLTPLPDGRYVATLDVSRLAFEQGIVDQALLANGIKIAGKPIDARSIRRGARQSNEEEKVRRKVDEQSREIQSKPIDQTQLLALAKQSNTVDVVFVEASMEQIVSTFASLEESGSLLGRSLYREPAEAELRAADKYLQTRQKKTESVRPKGLPSAEEGDDKAANTSNERPAPSSLNRVEPSKANASPARTEKAKDQNRNDAKDAEREERDKEITDASPNANGVKKSDVEDQAGFAVRVPKPMPSESFGGGKSAGGGAGGAGQEDVSTDSVQRAQAMRQPNKQFANAGPGGKLDGMVRIVLVIRALPHTTAEPSAAETKRDEADPR